MRHYRGIDENQGSGAAGKRGSRSRCCSFKRKAAPAQKPALDILSPGFRLRGRMTAQVSGMVLNGAVEKALRRKKRGTGKVLLSQNAPGPGVFPHFCSFAVLGNNAKKANNEAPQCPFFARAASSPVRPLSCRTPEGAPINGIPQALPH